MPALLTLFFLASNLAYASNHSFAEEALKNILSYHETSSQDYFNKIKPFFTPEAFDQYQQSFKTTNLPLIETLSLSMSGQITPLQESGENQLTGDVTIDFQGSNIHLSQKLISTVTLTKSDGVDKIKHLHFDSAEGAKINIKSYEEKIMCLKRKGLSPKKQ